MGGARYARGKASEPAFLDIAALDRSVPDVSDLTHILAAAQEGNPIAADLLLPVVSHEVRKLAACKMAQEAPGYSRPPWCTKRGCGC